MTTTHSTTPLATTPLARPGSQTATLIAAIQAHGDAISSTELAEIIGIPRSNIHPLLKSAVLKGIVRVSIEKPDGKRPQSEYRMADAGDDASPPPALSGLVPLSLRDWQLGADSLPGEAPKKQPKPGVGQNPGSARSVATGHTSAEAPAVTAQATPRPEPERRETGPAPAPAAAGDVDPINHPPHYTRHPSGIECIQITEHMGFNLGNAIKYLWRADLKGAAIDDLRKAQWYIARELQKREQTQPAEKEAA